MAEIYKSYDIRGIYPDEINKESVYDIGRALVTCLGASVVAVGEDNRSSSPELREALVAGMVKQGADVILLGELTTPMLYFASSKLGTDAAVMITASHNPPQYNGLKICRENAVPMGLKTGLADIREIVKEKKFSTPEREGSRRSKDIKAVFNDLVVAYADLGDKNFRVATDTAHAMGVLELPALRSIKNITLTATLYDTLMPPGTCPHEANPLLPETLHELQKAVVETQADIGIAYDGDADRMGFVDEKGDIVPMDLVTGLLAKSLLPGFPGRTVLYDLRSSRAVKNTILTAEGIPKESMVGHANIKRQMLETNALMAGEASGHYYFALEGYAAEMGTLTAILVLNTMAKTGKKLSELVAELRTHHHSGEINFRVENAPEIIARLKERYNDGTMSELDGIKIEFPEWWFSVRTSNTEPLLRLNLEASTPDLLQQKKTEILSIVDPRS